MTPQDQEVPFYRVITPGFFEPDLVEAGSKVYWTGPPGDHLEPLNAAAEARMAAWFEEEVEAIETATGKKLGKVKPHRGMQFISPSVEEERPSLQVHSVPDHDDPSANIMTLAEITSARKSTNQRPGPAASPKYKDKPVAAPQPTE